MKTLIISDTHLTHKFSAKTYEFLKKIIASCDQLIINGDLWDGYYIGFNRFLHSKWSGLFPLMKSKNAVYIFGNHDKELWMDDRTFLFSNSTAYNHTLELPNGKKIFIEHGDFALPAYKKIYENSRILLRLLTIPYMLFTISEQLLTVFLGRGKEKYIFWEDRKGANDKIKASINLETTPYALHIFSHTHLCEENLPAKYINTGKIMYGLASYVMIDGNEVTLVDTNYS